MRKGNIEMCLRDEHGKQIEYLVIPFENNIEALQCFGAVAEIVLMRSRNGDGYMVEKDYYAEWQKHEMESIGGSHE